MVELQGIPVSPGVAIGPALVLDADGYRIPRCLVAAEDADSEYARLRDRRRCCFRTTWKPLAWKPSAVAGEETGDIFAAQLQMLHDPRLHGELKKRIRQPVSNRPPTRSAVCCTTTPPHCVGCPIRCWPIVPKMSWTSKSNCCCELGAVTRQPLSDLTEPVIVLSHVLTPSETANLDRRYVRGFCTETGGPGGHTAIVAKGWNCPPWSGSDRFLDSIAAAAQVIVDGDRGRVIIDPDRRNAGQLSAAARTTAHADRAVGRTARPACRNGRRRSDSAECEYRISARDGGLSGTRCRWDRLVSHRVSVSGQRTKNRAKKITTRRTAKSFGK